MLIDYGCFFVVGLIVGAIIRFTYTTSEVSHLAVVPQQGGNLNLSAPPDSLWLILQKEGPAALPINKTYAYLFKGEVVNAESKQIEQKVRKSLDAFVI